MNKNSILYGLFGLLVGIVITALFANYAVNNNNDGMMRTMGMNNNRFMSRDVDRHFIEQMIPHHESAIAMAELALEKAGHSEIKKLADDIVTTQTAEIRQMRQWYKEWYGTDVPETNGGHMQGRQMMMGGESDINTLRNAADFDKAFLESMIPHHQMAVMMATMLQSNTDRAEMQRLANDIIRSQTKEIADMRSWQTQWAL